MRFLVFFTLISISFAQFDPIFPPIGKAIKNLLIPKHISTQKQLAKFSAKNYWKRFPQEAYDCVRYFMTASSYHKYQRKKESAAAIKDILFINSHKTKPSTDNQFSFGNGEVGNVCERSYGYCHGYTYSLVMWNRLAHFDPTNFNKAMIPDKETQPEEWFNFYRRIIDEVNKRKPMIIPGFKNLYEFSDSDPRITNYLKERIAINWADRNISFGGLKLLAGAKDTFTAKEALKLHTSLTKQIAEGYNPIISLASKSEGSWKDLFQGAGIHVMQAYEVGPIIDGQYNVKFWDIYSPKDANQATNTVTINTKVTDEKNRPELFFQREVQFDGKEETSTAFGHSDIVQVHFDKTFLGRDLERLSKFYQSNYEFYKVLYKEQLDRIANPPPPYKVPYTGPPLPPIILSDGSHWHWPKEMIMYTGEIQIHESQRSQLPDEVVKIIEKFIGPSWKSLHLINQYSFQVPPLTDEMPWKLEMIDSDGFINLTPEIIAHLPEQTIKELKEATSNKKLPKEFYLKGFTNRFTTNSPDDWAQEETFYWPIDFYLRNGKYKIPNSYLPKLSKDAQEQLKLRKLYGTEKEFYLQNILNGIYGKIILPIQWIDVSGKITIPHDENLVPTDVKEMIVGPGSWPPPDNFDFSRVVNANPIRLDSGEEYRFPLTWYLDSDDPWNMKVRIPIEHADYVPMHVRHKIMAPEKWPPRKAFMLSYTRPVYISGERTWNWPLTWIEDFNTVRIPLDEAHILPPEVRAMFKKWPVDYINVHNFQAEPMRFGARDWSEPTTDIYIYPRKWQTELGQILIPRSDWDSVPQRVKERLKEHGLEMGDKQKLEVQPFQVMYPKQEDGSDGGYGDEDWGDLPSDW
jgi:hypothetical protein